MSTVKAQRYPNKTGLRFGRLVVIGLADRMSGTQRVWACQCDCGRVVEISTGNLSRTKSCGCIKGAGRDHYNATHGMSGTKVYRRWYHMVRRCTNPKDSHWPYYGGRGIAVCERWLTFENFYADMGEPPAGTTLDRIDVDGDYEPLNCRWATPKEQARNRRNTAMLTFRGETLPLAEWAERFGLGVHILHGRLNSGWEIEDALTTEVRA